ncbi:MAG: hypothetical protein ACO1NY_09980 [Pseudorhodoplanes sp.]
MALGDIRRNHSATTLAPGKRPALFFRTRDTGYSEATTAKKSHAGEWATLYGFVFLCLAAAGRIRKTGKNASLNLRLARRD